MVRPIKFLTLWRHSHAQYEIRVYAEAMRELIRPIVPVCVGVGNDGVIVGFQFHKSRVPSLPRPL